MTLILEISWSSASTTVRVRDTATHETVSEGSAAHAPPTAAHEQDPDDWWRATVAATAEALNTMAAMRLPIDEIALVLVDVGDPPGGLVVLDETGRLVGPALLGSHEASGADAAWLVDHTEGGADTWRTATGTEPGAGSTVALLSWLHRIDPDAWSQLHRVTVPTGWLVEQLTGEVRVGAHDAVGTGLLDGRGAERWQTELLAVVDATRDWSAALPHIVLTARPAGGLTDGAATALGLRPVLPVHAGAPAIDEHT